MGSELNEQSCAEQWGHSMPWIPPFSLPASLSVELTQLTGTWQVLCETPHDRFKKSFWLWTTIKRQNNIQ